MTRKKRQTSCKALKHAVVYDNGGETVDRYSIIIEGSVYGMSSDPFSPLGFNQYCGETHELAPPGKHLGKKISVKLLPDNIKAAICERAKNRN